MDRCDGLRLSKRLLVLALTRLAAEGRASRPKSAAQWDCLDGWFAAAAVTFPDISWPPSVGGGPGLLILLFTLQSVKRTRFKFPKLLQRVRLSVC